MPRFQCIIVIRGQHDRSGRDIWWVDHNVENIVEEQPPQPAPHNIWDACDTRHGNILLQNYGEV